jgi:hypothetical protein
MRVAAIDPGPTKSAFVVVNPDDMAIIDKGHIPNLELRQKLKLWKSCGDTKVACEGIQCYGMPVGAETFETCIWIGRYLELYQTDFTIVYRKAIKLHLCQNPRAKDPNIRQAILDRYEPTGGGKNPKIGIKKQPGPLFGVATHSWSALAVATYYVEAVLPNEDKQPFGEFSF